VLLNSTKLSNPETAISNPSKDAKKPSSRLSERSGLRCIYWGKDAIVIHKLLKLLQRVSDTDEWSLEILVDGHGPLAGLGHGVEPGVQDTGLGCFFGPSWDE
jgi:hypothetical protein